MAEVSHRWAYYVLRHFTWKYCARCRIVQMNNAASRNRIRAMCPGAKATGVMR